MGQKRYTNFVPKGNTGILVSFNGMPVSKSQIMAVIFSFFAPAFNKAWVQSGHPYSPIQIFYCP